MPAHAAAADEGNARVTRDMVREQVNRFHVEVSRVKRLRNTHVDFVPLEIRKCPLNRFAHGAVSPTRHAELPRPR